MSSTNVFDLFKLYKEYFGRGSYYVDKNGQKKTVTTDMEYCGIERNERPRGTIHYSKKNIAFNKIGAYGQDIWFPVKFEGRQKDGTELNTFSLEIEACTVSVNLNKHIIETPVIGRKGAVIEIANIENYKFTIRGFLIGKNRQVPEDEILTLKKLFETQQEVNLFGGYVELFLDKRCKVVVLDLEFPEVQGQNHWIRPFNLTCKSDMIDDLETIL